MDIPPVFPPLPEIDDGAPRGVVSDRVRMAIVLSLLAHVVVIATLAWLDREPVTRIDQHITQIALLHDEHGSAPPPSAPATPVAVTAPPDTPPDAPLNDPPATQPVTVTPATTPVPAAAVTPAPPVLAVAAPMTGFNTSMIDTARNEYVRTLGNYLRDRARTPPEAVARGLEGRAVVTFTVDRGGNVLAARISQSSGAPLLDAAALDTVIGNTPLPRPPGALPFMTLEIDLPVIFPPNSPAKNPSR